MSEKATVTLDGKNYEFPVITGTENEKAFDIGKLRAQSGYVTFDEVVLDNTQEPDYNHSVRDEDDKVVNTLELQKQMLASMKTYKVDATGKFVEVQEPILEPAI